MADLRETFDTDITLADEPAPLDRVEFYAPPGAADEVMPLDMGEGTPAEPDIDGVGDAADVAVAPERRRMRPEQVIALIIGLAVVVGAAYFFMQGSTGSSGDDAVVAVVNGHSITQSDVDVQVNLNKAINETMKQSTEGVTPDSVLSSMVYLTLALQDIHKHRYPDATMQQVNDYVASLPGVSGLTPASFTPNLNKYGVARSVFSDAVRDKLTVDYYISDKVVGAGKAADQSELLRNQWIASLYDTATAQISFPHPLRADTGPAAKVGRQAPEISGVDLNSGQQVALSQLKGHPVLVNFWATWCGPCKMEMPEIVAVYRQYKDSKGLVVLAVDTEDASAKNAAMSFIKDYQMTFPVIQDDNQQSLVLAYHIQATPSTFFVDANGVIQYVQIGAMNNGTLSDNLSKVLR